MSQEGLFANPMLGDDSPENAGFESEAWDTREKNQNNTQQQTSSSSPRNRLNEMLDNIKSIFGHGVGKVVLILSSVVGISCLLLVYRNMTSKPPIITSQAAIDVPNVPEPGLNMEAISQKEALRRAQRATLEAQEAAAQGQTYQPGFDTNIIEAQQKREALKAMPFDMVDDEDMLQESGLESGSDHDQNFVKTSSTDRYIRDPEAETQTRQRLAQELKKARTERDQHITDIKEQVLKQAEDLLGETGQGGVNAQGIYSVASYYPYADRDGQNKANSSKQNMAVTNIQGVNKETSEGPTFDQNGEYHVRCFGFRS